MVEFVQNWETAHTVWLLIGLGALGFGILLFTVVFDSVRKSVTKVLGVMTAAKAAAAAPTQAEANAADVTERTLGGVVGELFGFFVGAVGLAIIVGVFISVNYRITIAEGLSALETVKTEKAKVEASLQTAQTEAEAAKKQAESVKTQAEKDIAAAKVPPPPVAVPKATYDPTSKKLAVSDPPDGTWFLQVVYKGGKPDPQGFRPAPEIEVKTGTPEFVTWFREETGGNVRQSAAARVELKK